MIFSLLLRENMLGNLGDRLRIARKHLNLNIDEMAIRCGLKSGRSWGVYERENRPPKADILLHMHNMGISIPWLLTGEGQLTITENNVSPAAPLETPLLDQNSLNRDLMSVVIELTEAALQERNAVVPPDKKAVLFLAIHDLAQEEQAASSGSDQLGPKLRERINTMIRLAS